MDIEQVRQNLIDRGRVLEVFLSERRKIILEVARIQRLRKNETRMLENIEYDVLESKLLEKLED